MISMRIKDEYNAYQRAYRRETGNISTKKYEKTKKGFLMRAYRNMQSRVDGVQWKKAHLYKNLTILPRKDFYEWSINNSDFNTLFDDWELNVYDRRLSPSVNRIDPTKGYELDNMEWITHSENSRLGAMNRNSR